MTDFPIQLDALPNRLGTELSVEGDQLVVRLVPRAETCRAGRVRASVISFVVDAAAGAAVDADPDSWTFTSDMRVRMDDLPAPEWVEGRSVILRQSKRSATCEVHVTGPDGVVGYGTLGFVKIPRREGDPPKPRFDPDDGIQLWRHASPLEEPLTAAAGISVLDPVDGIVEVEVVPQLCNPSGTLQGAMVALVAEVAAEQYLGSRLGGEVVVVDLEVRYLTQARDGVVRSRCQALGDDPLAPVRVGLDDAATGRLLTLVVARGLPAVAP